MKYNHPGLVVDLAAGLYAWPMPMDYDGDGDIDLVVSSPDVPMWGLWLFENPGGDAKMPLFKHGVRIARTKPNLQVSYVEGEPRVLGPNVEYDDFLTKHLRAPRKLLLSTNVHPNVVQANQWKYVDYDDDGRLDLLIGVGDWTDYGWDDAFDAEGNWTNGPLHGYVYLARNIGTNEQPEYAQPVMLSAGGRVIDVYGMPSPNMADFDGDGDLDLLCGEFVDKFTYYENTGTRAEPRFAGGEYLKVDGEPLHAETCMIVAVAFDWDCDGHMDLIVGQEDGRVMWIRHTGRIVDGVPQFEPPRYFQQEADAIKVGSLSTPYGFDWDNDGKQDLICGSAPGHIVFIKNLGGNPPSWAAPERLQADGREIRIQAGPNGSTQGPCEAKWGYTVLNVADLDQNNLPDLVVNSIWGRILWYRNVGTRERPRLAAAQPVQVNWNGPSRSPAWNWWKPKGNDWATQWRSSVQAIDLTGDGLDDLVALDEEGYLALFERDSASGPAKFLPGKRIFYIEDGQPNAFNHQSLPISFDMDQDGFNDLTHLNSKHELAYYATLLVKGMKVNTPNKRVSHAGDPRYDDLQYSHALRLTAGWSGRGGRRKFVLTDWDQDGKIDLLTNSVNVDFFRNVSNESGKFVFQDLGPVNRQVLAGHSTCPTVVDWNHDNIPDLLVGAEDGFLYYLENPLVADLREVGAFGEELPQ